MSGPKCTNYRLQEQRRRELERKRLQQEKQKNLQILTKIKQRINSYQYLQENQKNQAHNNREDNSLPAFFLFHKSKVGERHGKIRCLGFRLFFLPIFSPSFPMPLDGGK